jgi:hypothetical protein
VRAEAIVDEVDVMLRIADAAHGIVVRRNPIERKASAAAVGKELSREHVIVFVVFDQQNPDFPSVDQR